MVMLNVMLIGSTKLVIFCPAMLADMTGDPIALYVVFSDTVWLILIGKSTLSAYKENSTPTRSLVTFSKVLAGIVMSLIADAYAFGCKESGSL